MASGTRRSLGSLQLSRPTTTTTVARRGQLSVCVAGDRANYFHQERALGSLSSIPAITSRPWQAYPQLQQRNQQQQQQRYPSPAGAIATLSTLSRTRGQDRDRRSSSSESSPAWSSGASGMLFLTVTLLSSSDSSRPAEAAWWPFSGWGWLAGQSGSPFDGVVPERARKQRAKAEVKMRKYLERMHGPIQEQIAAYHAGKVRRAFVILNGHTLFFTRSCRGISPPAPSFVETCGSFFGDVLCCDALLQIIEGTSPDENTNDGSSTR